MAILDGSIPPQPLLVRKGGREESSPRTATVGNTRSVLTTMTGRTTMNTSRYSPRTCTERDNNDCWSHDNSLTSTPPTQTEFCFSTIHAGRAMPKLAAWGPSGLPYFSQFSRDSSSVSLCGTASTSESREANIHVSDVCTKVVHLRLIGLGNPHELLLVPALLVRMVHLAQSTILLSDLCH